MTKFPKKLSGRIENREAENAMRSLSTVSGLVDFSSNDYLGFSRDFRIEKKARAILEEGEVFQNGATGSRLLTGNHGLYVGLELLLSQLFDAEAALVFNSGYDANIGFFSSVPQRNDIVFYDELCHASIRDGIALGNAKSIKFAHNDLTDLKKKLRLLLESQTYDATSEIYVVTESVFSMDGDSPDLLELSSFCGQNGLHLVLDEAHALGVFGQGLVNTLGIQDLVFARVLTFGKALGVHGAAVLGSMEIKRYLINFARSFIYTTGMPPHTLALILASCEMFASEKGNRAIELLSKNISEFRLLVDKMELNTYFETTDSPIQICRVGGNNDTKELSKHLEEFGFDVRPVLAPTVPKGKERLRFCIHTYNTREEMENMLLLVKNKLYQ